MSDILNKYLKQIVSIITNDGRHYIGVLLGYDNNTNVIINQSHERIYSTEQSVQQIPLGLYIIRGDNVSVIGLVDQDKDLALDLSNIYAQPLKHIVH